MGKKKNNKPGVMLYFEILPALEGLLPWQRLALLEGMIRYARDGIEPKLGRSASSVWALIRPVLDRDDERYQRVLSSRSKGGKARAAKLKEAREAPGAAAGVENGENVLNVLKQEGSEAQNVLEHNEQSAETCLTCQSAVSNPQSPIPSPQTAIPTPQSFISNLQEAGGPTVEEVRSFCAKEGLETNAEDFVEYYASMGWRLSGGPVRDWKTLARRWHRKAVEKRKEENAYGNYGIVM